MAKTGTLVETFDVDDGTFVDAVAGGTIADGVCEMPYVTASTVKQTADTFDLTGSHLFAQVTHDVTNGNETYFQYGTAGGIFEAGQEMFAMSSTTIFFREVDDAGIANEVTAPYDPVAMAWLRLRHAGSTVYWDTSPDGVEWLTRRSKEPAIDLSSGRAKLAGFNSSADQPDAAVFDNVNTNGVAPVPQGSWESLLQIYRGAEAEYAMREASPPSACPIDGTPLQPDPYGNLVCPFDDHFVWPRDDSIAIR